MAQRPLALSQKEKKEISCLIIIIKETCVILLTRLRAAHRPSYDPLDYDAGTGNFRHRSLKVENKAGGGILVSTPYPRLKKLISSRRATGPDGENGAASFSFGLARSLLSLFHGRPSISGPSRDLTHESHGPSYWVYWRTVLAE